MTSVKGRQSKKELGVAVSNAIMASEKMSLPHIFIGLGIALQLERKLTVVMKQKGGGVAETSETA